MKKLLILFLSVSLYAEVSFKQGATFACPEIKHLERLLLLWEIRSSRAIPYADDYCFVVKDGQAFLGSRDGMYREIIIKRSGARLYTLERMIK